MLVSSLNIVLNNDNFLFNIFNYISTFIVKKHSSGMFSYLPFGVLIKRNIERFIIDNQSQFGLEVETPILESAKTYQACGRDQLFGSELYTVINRRQQRFFISPTCEEVFLNYFLEHNRSYKRFPLYLFQLSIKCRDEIRPRNTISRTCIFTMFDGYSFHIDACDANAWYKKISKAFMEIFNALGIKVIVIPSDPSSMLGQSSEEFFVASTIRESSIDSDGTTIHGIELAHIFHLGTVYSEKMNKCYIDKNDKRANIHMCSFGIGIDRLVLMCVENLLVHNRPNRIVFPYKFCFLPDYCSDNDDVYRIYYNCSSLERSGIVLFDLLDYSFDKKVKIAQYLGVEYLVYKHAQEVICKDIYTMERVDLPFHSN